MAEPVLEVCLPRAEEVLTATIAPHCTHCAGGVRLVTGEDVYPHRRDLAEKPIWRCECGAYVGCHRGTTTRLGTPANALLRSARREVHVVLDPIWETAPNCPDYQAENGCFRRKGASRSSIKRVAQIRVYEFLADQLGLSTDQCHVGMFDAGQCAAALGVLQGRTYSEIRNWARARRGSAAVAS